MPGRDQLEIAFGQANMPAELARLVSGLSMLEIVMANCEICCWGFSKFGFGFGLNALDKPNDCNNVKSSALAKWLIKTILDTFG